MKAWFIRIAKSKTMWLALAVEVAGILELVQMHTEDFRLNIPPEYFGFFLLIIGISIRVLRVATTTSIKDK